MEDIDLAVRALAFFMIVFISLFLLSFFGNMLIDEVLDKPYICMFHKSKLETFVSFVVVVI
jgi:hypothetical protein